MATAISESYDSYFSDGAQLTIKDQTFDPPVAFGSQVPSGYNEDGEFMSGSFVSNVEALPAADMTAQALADKLNGNFGAFPISEDDLPAALRTWTLQDGAVVFGTDNANITYVPVERPDPSINYDYKDGTYYGRDANKKVIVRITVADKKIVSAEVVAPADFDAANSESILAALLKDQTVKNASDGTSDDQTLKAALSVAVNKALLGDTSTYDPADPSSIFAGGTGTQNDPYQIATAAQLRAFAAAVNADEHFDGEYIVLTADIDLGDAQWMPVGSAGGHYFAGIFDGQNHCIRGMKIGTQETPADYVSAGLFACIDGAVVRNLAVADAEIYIARLDAVRTYAGIIAGVTDNSETGAGAVINNCTVSGTIYNKSVDWSQNGGITAYCYNSMILNCGAQVDITSISTGGTALAGGIVGQDGFAIVANNYARGSIYAEAGVNSATIGGIAGMQAGVAGNNYADVKLVSKNATGDIGGITGRNTAIGTIIYGYFNKEQEQRSGNSVIAEPKAVGENVTMLGNTGVVKETAGMTAAELRSEAFRDLLNDNQCEDKELRTALAQGISDFDIVVREAKLTIDSWVLDGIVRQGNAPTIRQTDGHHHLCDRGRAHLLHARRQRPDGRQHALHRRVHAHGVRNGQGHRRQGRLHGQRDRHGSVHEGQARHRLCRCGGGRLVLRRRPVGRRCGCHERHEQGSFLARYELHPRAGGHVPVERRRQADAQVDEQSVRGRLGGCLLLSGGALGRGRGHHERHG